MKILDCESPETTYSSLETILGVGADDLRKLFNEIDVDAIYKTATVPLGYGDEVLFSAIAERVGRRHFVYDQTCWFHLTRTVGSNAFENGILPTTEAVAVLWDFLYELLNGEVSEVEWEEFKKNIGTTPGFESDTYRIRLMAEHSGPYAILVRDIAFIAKQVGNHDYFDMPEIVLNIAMCLPKNLETILLSAFRRRTKPCIVKFADTNARQECLWKALYYLYCLFRGDELSGICCNTCFAGHGGRIPKTQILKIEFPEYHVDEIKNGESPGNIRDYSDILRKRDS